jgi:hypothetical protein
MAFNVQPWFLQEHPTERDTPEALRRYLCTQIQAHLHVVLCVSPEFMPQLARFSGLVAACNTIDALPMWSENTLAELVLRPLGVHGISAVNVSDEYAGAIGAAMVIEDESLRVKLASILGKETPCEHPRQGNTFNPPITFSCRTQKRGFGL